MQELELSISKPRPKQADASTIASRLHQQIMEGNLGYNQRLPAERQLAEQFGASRGTIRNALLQLERMNLVNRKVGSGTYVCHNSDPISEVARATSPLKLIDVRIAIEPAIVRLAVLHASAYDIQRLEGVLLELESRSDDAEHFSRADERFHITLAEGTQNPLMAWVYRSINEVRNHSQWAARKDRILTPKRIAEYNQQHRTIVRCVKNRDMEGAVNAITCHLLEARNDMIGRNQNDVEAI